MTSPDRPHAPPAAHVDDAAPARLRLTGDWTIEHATALSQALGDAPCALDAVDATGIARLDSLGVLQLLRFSRRCGADFAAFDFREEHRALVSAIDHGKPFKDGADSATPVIRSRASDTPSRRSSQRTSMSVRLQARPATRMPRPANAASWL